MRSGPLLWMVALAGCSGEIEQLRWELHEDVRSFAWVSWRQGERADARVEYSFDPGEWLSTPVIEARAGKNQALVAGIPYGHEARWRVVLDDGTIREAGRPIQTEAAPENLPQGRLQRAVPQGWYADGTYLLTSISQPGGGWSSSGPFWTVILDRQARPVWVRRTRQSSHWTLYAQVSVSGDHLLLDEFRNFGGGDALAIRTYLDEEIEEIPIPGHHHAFVEMPDGSLVWGSRGHGGGEALVEKQPGQKGETVLWTCESDWTEGHAQGCRSNCVFYDEDRDSFLISFYTNESVVEIDRASGSTLWWAGDTAGGYAFDPPESQFIWQHGVTWTDAGTLLLSTHDFGGARRTNEAREYVVDHERGVLEAVWAYDAEAFAATNGDTWRLPNGNTLHTLGSASLVKEVDADGEVVWHLDYNEGGANRLMGRSEWISDLYSLLSPSAAP